MAVLLRHVAKGGSFIHFPLSITFLGRSNSVVIQQDLAGSLEDTDPCPFVGIDVFLLRYSLSFNPHGTT